MLVDIESQQARTQVLREPLAVSLVAFPLHHHSLHQGLPSNGGEVLYGGALLNLLALQPRGSGRHPVP